MMLSARASALRALAIGHHVDHGWNCMWLCCSPNWLSVALP
jgi:hypothetical protein